MTARLRLSPWARASLTPDEVAGIDARLAVLGCYVTVVGSNPGGPWSVFAADRSVSAVRYDCRGSLAAAVHVVLDEWRGKRAEVDADLARLVGVA